MFDPLAAPQTIQDVCAFILLARRQQQRNRFAGHLLRRVSENGLRAGIPVGYNAFEGLGHNRVLRRGDDRRQPAIGFLRGLPTRDIDQDAAHLNRPTLNAVSTPAHS